MASKVKKNQTINQAYPVEQQSPPTVHIKMVANACFKRNTNVKDIFSRKNIVNSVIKLHLWCPFSSIDDWINAHWVPSLNTAHINVLNQFWESYKSILSLISHEPVVIFYNLVGNVKINTDDLTGVFQMQNFDGKLFII